MIERQISLEGGSTQCTLGPLGPSGDGHVVECTLYLQHIQPERRLAVGLWAAELSPDGTEHPRGTQLFTLPPHHGGKPQDIALEEIQFLLPGDLDESGGGPRRLVLRAHAHYIDGNERCLLPV